MVRGTAFVGRESRLGELRGHWRAAAAGRGGLVVVSGEAGIGKTRLVGGTAAAVATAPLPQTSWIRRATRSARTPRSWGSWSAPRLSARSWWCSTTCTGPTPTRCACCEVHELVARAIPAEETRPVDELVALPEGELFAAVPGEPALVLVAPPGEDAIPVVGDGTLDAGRYLVVCAIPTGADPDELMRQAQQSQGPPDVAGGPAHFTAGIYTELVVD